jgi:ankyrin repeat protein
VKVPSGQGELDTKRPWVVEPLGTVAGTNGFGATISIAAVRFLAYYDPQDLRALTGVPRGIKPTSGINLQLVEAVVRGDVEAASDLLARGADPNSFYNDAFMDPCIQRAVKAKNAAQLVRLLLQYKADVNRESGSLDTAMDLAGESSDEVVKMLIDAGAKINHKTSLGDTPLHMAVVRPSPVIVKVLLAKGADVNAKNSVGEAPLLRAAQFERSETVDILLGHGADTNAQDNHGETALIAAVRHCGLQKASKRSEGVCSVMKVLLDHGANPSLRDTIQNQTAFDVAKRFGIELTGTPQER